MGEPRYECPTCLCVAPWTDGTLAEDGLPEVFWCQTCGAETPLAWMRTSEPPGRAGSGAK